MPSLIEEATQRATERLDSLLTLIQLQFETGLAHARELSGYTGRVIDPVATCCYEEARELLLRPEPNLALALMALSMAALREPSCYGSTHLAIQRLLLSSLQQTVDLEYERELLGEQPGDLDAPELGEG